MKTYKIRDWAILFENNRSRMVKDLDWIPIPNRHDGENYTSIITDPDGAIIYAAWVLILQVASRCQPRGTLLRDNGTPHSPRSLAMKTRAPEKWFELALNFLENHTDWLEIEGERQDAASTLPARCQQAVTEGKGREGNRREEKESACALPAAPGSPFPEADIPSWDDVKAKAAMSGVPEASAKKFYDHHEGNQLWVNQGGRLINWPYKLTAWAANDRTTQAKESPKIKLPSPGPTREAHAEHFKQKWGDDKRCQHWEASFWGHWTAKAWRRGGSVIDWQIEAGEYVAKQK